MMVVGLPPRVEDEDLTMLTHAVSNDLESVATAQQRLLEKVGVRLDSFADSDGKVNELFKPISI